MSDFHEALYAPWRLRYLEEMNSAESGGKPRPTSCFLCGYASRPAGDRENLVLWRTPHSLVLLNSYPYASGHVMVVPTAHVDRPEALAEEALRQSMLHLRDAQLVLRRAFEPEGFNVGMNVGRCAGAGVPDHIHWHIVPRWSGDTNFTTVVGGVRVIPHDLAASYEKFKQAAEELRLPAG